jgi:hypothetical protein
MKLNCVSFATAFHHGTAIMNKFDNTIDVDSYRRHTLAQ